MRFPVGRAGISVSLLTDCSQSERRGFLHHHLLGYRICLGWSGSNYAHQFIVACDQVSILVQIADDEFGSLSHLSTNRDRAQLPHQVIRKIAGLGKKIFERRAFDIFHFARAAVAGIEVVLKERAKINLFEGIFLLLGCYGSVFRGGAVALFLPAAYFIE